MMDIIRVKGVYYVFDKICPESGPGEEGSCKG